MMYKNAILSKLESGRSAITDIKGIMLQSTGSTTDSAATFYDNLQDCPDKEYAHYVIEASDIGQYNYVDSSVFTDEVFTIKAKELLVDASNADDSPAYHILAVEIIMSSTDYASIEKNLVKFLGELLVKYNLSTDNLWRRGDIVCNTSSNPPQYATLQYWNAFLDCVKAYVVELKSENPNTDNVTTSGATIPIGTPTWESDTRTNVVLAKIDIEEFSEQDYEITIQGDIQTKKDKFTGYVAMINGDKYEPIYPDLTVPPASSTRLYSKSIDDVRKIVSETKPVMGKIVNNQDPYPTDEKIAELEEHYPRVKLEDSVLNEMQGDTSALTNYLVTMSQRVERRLTQLENITSTAMRYLFRLGSRININCVYYGGQSQFDKYSCIRCMQDDMVNDGQVVTLDQCLNCARYEPIIGQYYDILDNDYNPNTAPLLDDLQASHMSNDDYVKLTRVEQMVDENEKAICDEKALGTKDSNDKTFSEVMQKDESYVMNWSETDWDSQTPDINTYKYDAENFVKAKAEFLKPENRHKDYYDGIEKRKFPPKSDAYNSATSTLSFSGEYDIDDYDWTNAKTRLDIVQIAKDMVTYACQEKVLYVYGSKVKEQYMDKTPAELVGMLPNTQPCVSSVDPVHTEQVSVDCSGFARYCYKHNGIEIPDGSNNQMKSMQTVGQAKDFDKSLNQAIPGDLIFYSQDGTEVSHVAVYIGGGKMAHAASAKHPKNSQVLIGKVYKENFYSIGRNPNLALPKLKSMRYLNLSTTLTQAAAIQLPHSTGFSGTDNASTSIEEVIKYMDPNGYCAGDYKYQFLHLGMYSGCTAEQIAAFFRKINASQNLIDNADAFIEGAKRYGVNEVYLAAHCSLESGKGTSKLANGSMIGPSGKTIYNMYGIAAYNSDPQRIAARKKADQEGWHTVSAAIIGGAKFVAEGYIAKGQKTLYEMRWNPLQPGTHQYATDVGWAIKQTSSMAEILSNFSEDAKSKLIFEVPIYKS